MHKQLLLITLDSVPRISPVVTVGCRLSSELTQGGSLLILPSTAWLMPACWLKWSTHLVLVLGLRPSGFIPPAASALFQLMFNACRLFKWLNSQEHLLCSRANCNVSSDIWSDCSQDRSGLQRDRHLDFCCPGKARPPISSSESKQTFLPFIIAPKCGKVLVLCLALLPPVSPVPFYSGSNRGRGDHKYRPVLLKLGGLIKTQIARPTPRISDSAVWVWANNLYF